MLPYYSTAYDVLRYIMFIWYISVFFILFLGLAISGIGGHKQRVNQGEDGRCTLYSYVKTEEENLLKLFGGGGEERTLEGINLRYIVNITSVPLFNHYMLIVMITKKNQLGKLKKEKTYTFLFYEFSFP
jgi:hypothetical protein